MNDAINQVDLAFVVDTTGSMGPFLHAAQRQMVSMIHGLVSAADVAMRLGVVEYRDHPPQDRLLTRAVDFTADLRAGEATIGGLRHQGGGDGPEAVFDGVIAACNELNWRPHARRLIVLVGDAPPHGVGAPGDAFRTGCPCGQTIETVTATAEELRITLYALGLTSAVTASFQQLARFTGGEYFTAGHGDAAIQTLQKLLATEFGQLELDRAVLDEWTATGPEFLIDETARKLGRTSGDVAAAVTRLSARELLRVHQELQPASS
jgi:hypothetical protein